MPPNPATRPASDPAVGRAAVPGWWPWGVGLLLGLVVIGPGLGGGSLLSLDLMVTPSIPVPNGLFGLGPSLSQRVPLFGLLAAGSALVGGPVATKAFLVACTAAGFAGAARLARLLGTSEAPVGVVGQLAAGLLWAGGPYALTRIGVGHVNLVWAVAVLPWALPRLCRPADHLPSTFLASFLLAMGGPGGGTLGLTIAGVGLVLQPAPRRWLRPIGAVLAPHARWVAPTAVLLWAGAGVNGAGRFSTVARGLWGWPSLAAGGGFWRSDYQVAAHGPLGALAGAVLLALAVVGARRVVADAGWRSWQGAATASAILGLVLAAASALPGVRVAYDALSELPFGAPLRESQRFAALWLVWAAPVVVVGAGSLAGRLASPAARRALVAVPLLVALAVSVPGWWGVGGRLEPVEYPQGWAAARILVSMSPGPVVALPWSEYPQLSFAGGRQAFNPLPDYLGGDVISSYDPLFSGGPGRQEQVDPRAEQVDRIVRRLRRGEHVSARLRALGVRWVVLAHERSFEDYGALATDPGLRRRSLSPEADAYEVRGWRGPAVAADGSTHDVRRPVPPVLATDAPAGSVLDVAGAPGWVQGWGRAARVTADGRLQTTGTGTLWFWPAPLLVALDLALLGGAIWAIRSRRRDFGRILAPRAPRG
ncbi:MAG: hypothetical protein U0P45_08755 [Acidimicrobiales bacterium]